MLAYREDILSGDISVTKKHSLWEKQYWNDADRLDGHSADFQEIQAMCRRLNIGLSSADLLNIFTVRTIQFQSLSPIDTHNRKNQESDLRGQGRLDFTDFRHFVALLKARPDVQSLYEAVRGGTNFTYLVFERFMREVQRVSLHFNVLKTATQSSNVVVTATIRTHQAIRQVL
jgi:phosphatidylinositol phospholipase C delta